MQTQSTTLARPLIGQPWPEQGGILAAIMAGATIDGIQRPDVAIIVPADPAGHFEDVQWGAYGTEIAGATSPTDGAANTADMVTSGLPLAQQITALRIDGHADWFLPARRQLQALAANVPQLFNQDDWYWSSSQNSRDGAWVQDFEDGDSCWDGKGNEFRAVAVRQIQL